MLNNNSRLLNIITLPSGYKIDRSKVTITTSTVREHSFPDLKVICEHCDKNILDCIEPFTGNLLPCQKYVYNDQVIVKPGYNSRYGNTDAIIESLYDGAKLWGFQDHYNVKTFDGKTLVVPEEFLWTPQEYYTVKRKDKSCGCGLDGKQKITVGHWHWGYCDLYLKRSD